MSSSRRLSDRQHFLLIPILTGALLIAASLNLRAGTSPAENGVSFSAADFSNVNKLKEPRRPEVDVSYKELAVLHEQRDNPILQRFSLYGEFAAQWATGNSDRGSYGSRNLPPLNDFPSNLWGDIDARRWRLGARAEFLEVFKFTGIINVNPNLDPFYRDIYELYLTWAPSKAFNLSAGKRKAHFFTQEYNTPSRELIVFEQSLVTGLLIPRELTGAWVSGTLGQWTYTLAGYGGDYQTEFSNFDAGAVIQASLGYDLSTALDADKALLRFDYQGSTSGENSSGPEKFTNAFSLNTVFQKGRFYAYTDFLGGLGRGTQGDVFGVILSPTYFVVPNKLQAVLRYQYAHGENDGLKLQTRYEALASEIQDTKGVGSDYHAVYLGLNYYIHRHNFKVMTGVEYNDLSSSKRDFGGWTYLAGIRLAF